MRRLLLEAVPLLAVCCGAVLTLSATAVAEDHVIIAELWKDTHIFGNPIRVTIRYENNGTNDWRLRKPDNSLSTEVHFERVGNPERPGWYSMGKIRSLPGPEGAPMAFAMPEPQYFVLRTGERHTLASDLPWAVFPGRWILWVEDKIEGLRSETLGLQIVFTKESADILLGTARDTGEDAYKRRQRTKYLRELRPAMPEFRWPRHDDSPEEKSRKEALIQKHLREFEDFWKKEGDSPEVRKAIERINRVCRELTESRSVKDCPDILEFRR